MTDIYVGATAAERHASKRLDIGARGRKGLADYGQLDSQQAEARKACLDAELLRSDGQS